MTTSGGVRSAEHDVAAQDPLDAFEHPPTLVQHAPSSVAMQERRAGVERHDECVAGAFPRRVRVEDGLAAWSVDV